MQQIRVYEFFALDGFLPVVIWIAIFVILIFLAVFSWAAYDGAQYDERR
jgi:predicted negative regulator of RcsB-dependent stress response